MCQHTMNALKGQAAPPSKELCRQGHSHSLSLVHSLPLCLPIFVSLFVSLSLSLFLSLPLSFPRPLSLSLPLSLCLPLFLSLSLWPQGPLALLILLYAPPLPFSALPAHTHTPPPRE